MKVVNVSYIAQTGIDAKARLALQHRVFSPGTQTLLEMAEFHPQMRVLVVGCGCGDETIMIAKQLNQRGKVVALDISLEQIEQAKEAVATAHLEDKVSFLNKSIYDLDDTDGKFDLIIFRFFLAHLADPKKAIAILKNHLLPGGILAAQEPIISSCYTEPASPALKHYINLMMQFGNISNRNFDIAIDLPVLFEEVGLKVQVQQWQPIVLGKDKKMVTMSAVECMPALEKTGLITELEAKRLIVDINNEIIEKNDVILFQCINMLVIGAKY